MRDTISALETRRRVQASLPAKDLARVKQEGGVISRAEYEKYMAQLNNRD